MAQVWLVLVLLFAFVSTGLSESGKDAKVQDFLDWVARVGARNSSSAEPGRIYGANAGVATVLKVDKSGRGQFSSVQDAVDYVPHGNNQRVIIQIAAGFYHEKVKIPSSKPYITLQGQSASTTTISWQDTAAKVHSMPNSASVAINADYFIARDITFQNAAPPPSLSSYNEQGVAVRISGDKAAFYNCNFVGYQDTLFDDQGRHYFENCLIQGSVDFICGNGQSLYKGCELRTIRKSTEALAAQRRSSPNENTGFSFVDCTVTGVGMAYLGRAWGPYSRVVFSYTYMDDIIIPSGWNDFGNPSSRSKVFFGQYMCKGPGASESKRVNWSHELSASQAAPFQSISFVDGQSWLQQ